MVVARWLGVWCLALAMAWNPIAPPEHVHESDDHGSTRSLVHRHVEGHFGEDHQAAQHDAAEIDHQDDRVFTFDSAVAVPSAIHTVEKPDVVSTLLLLEPLAVPLADGREDHVERLSHSPPRAPTGLRAPPRSTRP